MVKPRLKEWNSEENKELMKFMEEGRNNGLQIRYLCELYAEKDPLLTIEQVRSHYYQLKSDPEIEGKDYKQGPWTEEEDDLLMSSMKENSTKMNKLEIFEYVSSKLNRNPRAVASHYYNLEKNKKQNNNDELDKFIYKMSHVDTNKLEDVLNKLKEIQKYSEKEKEILCLQEKLDNTYLLVENLETQLDTAQKTIESYNVKFENYKKQYSN